MNRTEMDRTVGALRTAYPMWKWNGQFVSTTFDDDVFPSTLWNILGTSGIWEIFLSFTPNSGCHASLSAFGMTIAKDGVTFASSAESSGAATALVASVLKTGSSLSRLFARADPLPGDDHDLDESSEGISNYMHSPQVVRKVDGQVQAQWVWKSETLKASLLLTDWYGVWMATITMTQTTHFGTKQVITISNGRYESAEKAVESMRADVSNLMAGTAAMDGWFRAIGGES